MGHSDDDLLRRILAGEEDAFVLLYQRWQRPLYRFALHMSGSVTIAEDVIQEVFMSLIREGSRFDPKLGTVPSYLFGIARNQVRRRFERDRFLVPLQESAGSDREAQLGSRGNGAHSSATVPPVDLIRGETVATVREAVLGLPSHYREVVVLCDLQEMSYEETAGVLKCAVGTVRSRLHRARALLAEKLSAFHVEASKAVSGAD